MVDTHNALFEVAHEYCSLIESARADDVAWLRRLSRLLPRLHALVTALEPVPVGAPVEPNADLDRRFELYSRLLDALGDLDSYWLEFDSPRGTLPATGSLADDLTDIYYDLKSGLERVDGGRDPVPTLIDWRTGFSVHWGQHLVDAERHLYALSARNQLA